MDTRGFGKLCLAAATVLLAASCSASPAGPTVLVDYSHDEFSSQFNAYFPAAVTVHPGDTVTFKQTWTGEPHTVTFGTLVEDMIEITGPLLEQYADTPFEEIPQDALEAFDAAFEGIPEAFDEETESIIQTAAQPCAMVDQADMPADGSPCPGSELPPFAGTELLYNSGIVPSAGAGQNRFDLVLAEDLAPGVYDYYCMIHGPEQRGTLEVVPVDEPIPTPQEVTLLALREIDAAAEDLIASYRSARDEGVVVAAGSSYTGNFAGVGSDSPDVVGQINAFVPEDITARVGEPVTWIMFGAHSIAFDVPEYFPIVEFAEDGTVTFNDEIDQPTGGAPPLPEGRPDGPVIVDGGTWDGDGFYSSGTLYSDDRSEFTLRFSTPGTWVYACLIHPPMVGTVRVTE